MWIWVAQQAKLRCNHWEFFIVNTKECDRLYFWTSKHTCHILLLKGLGFSNLSFQITKVVWARCLDTKHTWIPIPATPFAEITLVGYGFPGPQSRTKHKSRSLRLSWGIQRRVAHVWLGLTHDPYISVLWDTPQGSALVRSLPWFLHLPRHLSKQIHLQLALLSLWFSAWSSASKLLNKACHNTAFTSFPLILLHTPGFYSQQLNFASASTWIPPTLLEHLDSL